MPSNAEHSKSHSRIHNIAYAQKRNINNQKKKKKQEKKKEKNKEIKSQTFLDGTAAKKICNFNYKPN